VSFSVLSGKNPHSFYPDLFPEPFNLFLGKLNRMLFNIPANAPRDLLHLLNNLWILVEAAAV